MRDTFKTMSTCTLETSQIQKRRTERSSLEIQIEKQRKERSLMINERKKRAERFFAMLDRL
ncbi:hypothetical protein bcgnr5378_37750 [Bacillus cereus]